LLSITFAYQQSNEVFKNQYLFVLPLYLTPLYSTHSAQITLSFPVSFVTQNKIQLNGAELKQIKIKKISFLWSEKGCSSTSSKMNMVTLVYLITENVEQERYKKKNLKKLLKY